MIVPTATQSLLAVPEEPGWQGGWVVRPTPTAGTLPVRQAYLSTWGLAVHAVRGCATTLAHDLQSSPASCNALLHADNLS